MHDGKQVDLSAEVELVKRKTRPWKSMIALILAIASGVISDMARHDSAPLFSATNHLTNQFIAVGTAVAFGVFGSVATYSLAGRSRELLEPRTGTAHSGVVRYAILIVGAFATLVITLELLTVPVGQLVLGGALTSVFVGIAAQQALGNVFAGLVLLIARPFHLDGSVMSIPNSQVLNAVVGPVPREPVPAGAAAGSDGRSGSPGAPEQPVPRPAGPA